MDIIKAFTSEQLKKDVPVFNIGNDVKVYCRIVAKNGGGISETFTVRRISYGVGVEKTFPLHSPNVEKVVVTRVGKVRRAKLYYLRDRVGKSSKVKEIV